MPRLRVSKTAPSVASLAELQMRLEPLALRRTTARTPGIPSAWGAYRRVQRWPRMNENEYRCEGTSHAAPGYVLARQTPPTDSPRSKIRKSRKPARFRRMPMPTPPKPAPITATDGFARAPLILRP